MWVQATGPSDRIEISHADNMVVTEPEETGERIGEEALDWLVRMTSARPDEAEVARFRRWLEADPAHRESWGRLAGMWTGIGPLAERLAPEPAPVETGAVCGSWRRWISGIRVAALAAAAILLTVALWQPLRADFATGVGERREVALADGSSVALDADSAIALRFGGTARGVELLKGRADFKVTKDPSRPFLVTSGAGTIRAVGTEFVVGRTERGTSVAVIEGIVEIRDGSGRLDRLERGQGERYAGAGPSWRLSAAEREETTDWHEGYLLFHDAPLREVVARLAHYRSGLVLVLDGTLGDRRVSGLFPIAEIDKALAAVIEATHAKPVYLSSYLILLR